MKSRPDFLADEQLPPPARQGRSIDKRRRLMTAALNLFASQGYGATSIEAIASRAKLAIGTFYQHFESKRQLLVTLMDQLLNQLADVSFELPPATDAREALRATLARAFERDLAFVGAHRAWQEAIIGDQELQKKNAAMHAWTRQRVLRLLTTMQRAPGARRSIDLNSLAEVLDGLFWSLMTEALQLSPRDRDRRLEMAVHLVYHGMFTDAFPNTRQVSRRKT